MEAVTFVCSGSTAPTSVVRILAELRHCCMAAFEDGPAACTCWDPVYDLEQHPIAFATVETRTKMCDDCAFRPDSPERTGDERYSHSDEDITELDHFFCHAGARKPVAWRHATLGITVEADTDAYDPPMQVVDGTKIPFKADGTPLDRCAGHAAHAR